MNHYKSWRDNDQFKTLFIKFEDLKDNKDKIFRKIVKFINELNKNSMEVDEKKFINSINSTTFVNMKNKERNEGFEESVISKKTGKKLNFFNLGFNNRWQKILSNDIKQKMNVNFKNELKELGYNYE